MIKYKRPAKPAGFDPACANAHSANEAAIAANDDDALDFPDIWANYKDVLSASQFGKCGYCETMVVSGQHGDVEHYRPKGMVTSLLAAGQERPFLGNIQGRRFHTESSRGYWWGAYDWKNYLLSCMNCNQKWKKNLFPVTGARAAAPGQSEAALLMNPFDRRDPVNHLYFDDLGAIVAANSSRHGRATIETCGLDRPSLMNDRLEKARRAHQLASMFIEAVATGSDTEVATALRDIHEAGRQEFRFAGVIRAVIKHDCGMDWDEVESQVAALGPP